MEMQDDPTHSAPGSEDSTRGYPPKDKTAKGFLFSGVKPRVERMRNPGHNPPALRFPL
jgi:hypothetical protein